MKSDKLWAGAICLGAVILSLLYFNSHDFANYYSDSETEIMDKFSKVQYIHFPNMPISYEIKHPTKCFPGQENRTKLALQIIESSTEGLVDFDETVSDADLIIDCINLDEQIRQFSLNLTCERFSFPIDNKFPSEYFSQYRNNITEYKSRLVGQGMYIYRTRSFATSGKGASQVTEVCYLNRTKFEYDPEFILGSLPDVTSDGIFVYRQTTEGTAIPSVEGRIILNASVNLYRHTQSCEKFPAVEIHELLHAFGFAHSQTKGDIMYPYTSDCIENYHINPAYFDCLKYIYSNGQQGKCSGVIFLDFGEKPLL